MAYNPNQLTEFVREVTQLVLREDIRRRDWQRQTDAVRLACVVSQMWAENPDRVVLVDGRIENSLIREALNNGNVKGFFNQRVPRQETEMPSCDYVRHEVWKRHG